MTSSKSNYGRPHLQTPSHWGLGPQNMNLKGTHSVHSIEEALLQEFQFCSVTSPLSLSCLILKMGIIIFTLPLLGELQSIHGCERALIINRFIRGMNALYYYC